MLGITRESILLRLRSVHFPRSFPANIMRYRLQNITPTVFTIWNRRKIYIDRGAVDRIEGILSGWAGMNEFELSGYFLY